MKAGWHQLLFRGSRGPECFVRHRTESQSRGDVEGIRYPGLGTARDGLKGTLLSLGTCSVLGQHFSSTAPLPPLRPGHSSMLGTVGIQLHP